MIRRIFVALLSLLATLGLAIPGEVRAQAIEIVGGTEATPGAWPFMAALLESSGDPTSQFCGGSLIASTWVVSAAHCLVDNNGNAVQASTVKVGLGLHRLSSGGGRVFSVKRVIVHPQYNGNTNDYDIALLELNGTASQTPITLNTSSTDISGVTATAIGWGLTDPNNNNSSSDVLRQVNVPVVSNTTCDNSMGGGITARMVCAGFPQGGKDTCQGDSGGPLVATLGGVLKLIGLTSFGNGCAQPNSYGVYARVSQLQSFISQYVNLTPPNPPTATNGKYGLWNGFLGMTNIAELVNRSSQAVTAQINIFSIDGTLVSSNYYAVAANSQQDVILNELQGFSADSYGILQVSNNIDGRVFFYRATDSSFTDFEFAFGIPLQDGITGNSYVGFNTYQPSFNFGDQANVVANWLSIVNLATSSAVFTIRKYDSEGTLLSQQAVTVNAKSRSDFEAGHENPGPSHIGLIEIIPADGSKSYIAQLMRYGYGINNSFDFAFPLLAKSGDSSEITVPLGSQFLAQNWLEVLNSSSSSNSVLASFYNSTGSLVASQTYNLSAHTQQHINVNQILGDQTIGYVRIASQSSQRVVAESMFYYRNTISGSITAMYGSQAGLSPQGTKNGSFNLFLGLEDFVKLSNPSDSAISVNVTVSSAFSAGSSHNVSLPANSSTELSLHDTATYGTVANSYGTVTVTPSSASTPLVHEILRVKRETSGELQFAAPTGLQ